MSENQNGGVFNTKCACNMTSGKFQYCSMHAVAFELLGKVQHLLKAWDTFDENEGPIPIDPEFEGVREVLRRANPRTVEVAVVCKWCDSPMGTKPFSVAGDAVTHGMCPKCEKVELEKFDRQLADLEDVG